jgi:hypothetical protein
MTYFIQERGRLVKLAMKSCCMLLLAAMSCGRAFGGVGTTVATTWGDTDANLGVTGFTIVNFESKPLPSNLGISFVNGYDGTTGNWTTGFGGNLPFIVSPSDDHAGSAFSTAAWDGTHFLVNVPTIPITSYSASFGWGDITLSFKTGARAVGFSMQQANLNDTFLVNGAQVTDVSTLFGNVSGGRQGYVLFSATGASVINTLTIHAARNTYTDGWAIDHLAYAAAVPEADSYVMLLTGLGLLGFIARRREQTAP